MTNYVELHAHSFYSLLDGASSPAALVNRAAALGMPALALTDHDAIYGAVAFADAAKQAGIRPIFGAELTLHDDTHLTLLVKDAAGWSNLCQLVTKARANAEKGSATLPADALAQHGDGLIALSGCRKGRIAQALLHNRPKTALKQAHKLRELFGKENVWIELQNHHLPVDAWLNRTLYALGSRLGVGAVATNNVHYASADRHRLQDVLVCIKHRTTLDESELLRRPNSHYRLKSAEDMSVLFPYYPDALENTVRIAEQCQFELQFGLQHLPQHSTPDNQAAIVYVRTLCEGAMGRISAENRQKATAQLQHELGVIERAGLANYFLIVWDIVRFSRENGIRCQGRGSAANSLVSYLLGISPADPIENDLVFERFLSDERRGSVPDIDIDFDAARREEVIQYVYQKYGTDHAAMACTFSTFRSRAAIRDVSKVLQLSAESTAHAHDILHGYEPDTKVTPQLAMVVDLCQQLQGLPRHLGIHNGGMIIMAQPLATRIPVEPATMQDRTVVQWDKDALETAGIVKIDILGLRMLSAVSEANRLIAAKTGVADNLPTRFDDPAVYAMVSKADTFGVFQVESRAQQNVALPHIQPHCFNDLVVTISLIRPGPVQGNMVQPYFRRRAGLEPVTYLHPLLRPALEETLGIVLYQEQVLKVARDVAGFSAGQGELLRRALGKKDAYVAIEALRETFVDGAMGKGVSAEIAQEIFDKLLAFGGYSFAKSHAASFAVLVYQSAWLRCYHMPEFVTGLLNNQPMGFWSPAVLAGDARRRGVEVLRVDIVKSGAQCQVEDGNVRLGFSYVKRLGAEAIERLIQAREWAAFGSLADFCRRTKLPKKLVDNLIAAGTFDSWAMQRRQLMWQLGTLSYREDELPLMYSAENPSLPNLGEAQAGSLEVQTTGISTGRHVMAQIRPNLPNYILDTRKIELVDPNQTVTVGGVLVIRQQPQTAKGHVFLTLEDEFGLHNVVLRPKIATKFRRLLRSNRLLKVTGKLERKQQTINVIATHVAAL